MKYAFLMAFCWVSLPAAESPGYAGAPACRACHPAEYRLQSASEHAGALYPATSHPLAAEFLPKVPMHRDPDFDFRFVRDPRGFLVRVSNPNSAIVLSLEWAFGAGDQAVTFVSKAGHGSYLEDYFSYYPAVHGFDVTPGQERVQARDVVEAAGFTHQGMEIISCFGCHSTGTVHIAGGTVTPNETGVHCEACHGPAGDHVASKGSLPVRDPRRMTAVELNELCSKCHRSPPSKQGAMDWDDPWNVRYQPAYLGRSACFLKSAGKLSCITCHSPHEKLVRNDPAAYNKKCEACHAAVHLDPAKRNCIECHMPRVSPRTPISFTNHWIAVYRDGKRSQSAGDQKSNRIPN